MIILAGASASGKTELANFLMKNCNIKRAITATTRKPRIYEKDNVDYYFLSVKEFEKLIDEHQFVEFTKYGENYYGSLFKEIADNKCLVVDINGLKSYTKLKSERNIITIYLFANDEIRKERMIKRGDNIEDINLRLKRDHNLYTDINIGNVDLKIDTSNTKTEECATILLNFVTYSRHLIMNDLK